MIGEIVVWTGVSLVLIASIISTKFEQFTDLIKKKLLRKHV